MHEMRIHLSERRVDTVQEIAVLADEYTVTHKKGKWKLHTPAQTCSNYKGTLGNSCGSTLGRKTPGLGKCRSFGWENKQLITFQF